MVEIRPVSYADIIDAPNAEELIRSYASECSVPNAEPQPEIYAAMESAGALKCFGAYVDDRLVGFVSVLTAIMPHTGKPLVAGESIFVYPANRYSRAGDGLISAAERYADSIAASLTWLPRVGSQLDRILSHRQGYSLTHSQHTRRPS
jgi:hypothetical protein